MQEHEQTQAEASKNWVEIRKQRLCPPTFWRDSFEIFISVVLQVCPIDT